MKLDNNVLIMKNILFIFILLFSCHALAAYELHIERAGDISLQEWLDICDSDVSLEYKQSLSVTNPNTHEVISMSAKGTCVWTQGKYSTSFYFSKGNVNFRYSEKALKKAKEIASKLNAEVIGDEGEKY